MLGSTKPCSPLMSWWPSLSYESAAYRSTALVRCISLQQPHPTRSQEFTFRFSARYGNCLTGVTNALCLCTQTKLEASCVHANTAHSVTRVPSCFILEPTHPALAHRLERTQDRAWDVAEGSVSRPNHLSQNVPLCRKVGSRRRSYIGHEVWGELVLQGAV